MKKGKKLGFNLLSYLQLSLLHVSFLHYNVISTACLQSCKPERITLTTVATICTDMWTVTTVCTDRWIKSQQSALICEQSQSILMQERSSWFVFEDNTYGSQWAQKLAQSCWDFDVYFKIVLEDYVCCCVVYLDSWSCFQFMLQLKARFLLQVKYILTSIISCVKWNIYLNIYDVFDEV